WELGYIDFLDRYVFGSSDLYSSNRNDGSRRRRRIGSFFSYWVSEMAIRSPRTSSTSSPKVADSFRNDFGEIVSSIPFFGERFDTFLWSEFAWDCGIVVLV